jgi:hypothetical protein
MGIRCKKRALSRIDRRLSADAVTGFALPKRETEKCLSVRGQCSELRQESDERADKIANFFIVPKPNRKRIYSIDDYPIDLTDLSLP